MIFTRKNLNLITLRLGLKKISISNRLDNGQEEKIIFFKPLFGTACNLLVALNTDTQYVAFRLLNLLEEVFYFSLRIS